MPSFRLIVGGGLLGVWAFVLALTGEAQQARSIDDRVYSDAQATRGQQLYQKDCVTCHGAALEGVIGPPLAGDGFLAVWSGRSIGDLVTKIEQTMPPGQPGSVSPTQAIDLAAFILRSGKFAAGQSSRLSRIEADHVPDESGSCHRDERRGLVRAIEQPRAADARGHVSEREHPVQRAGEGPRQGQAGHADPVRLRDLGHDGLLRMAGGRSGGVGAGRDGALVLWRRDVDVRTGGLFPSIAPTGSSTAALVDVGKAAYAAAQSRNVDAVNKVAEQLNDTCANCHKVYRDGAKEGSVAGAEPVSSFAHSSMRVEQLLAPTNPSGSIPALRARWRRRSRL